jgi:hypothetical protein
VFKHLLISIVIAPTLIGLAAATSRRRKSGLSLFFGLLLTYNALYLVMLYYLRYRWVG